MLQEIENQRSENERELIKMFKDEEVIIKKFREKEGELKI